MPADDILKGKYPAKAHARRVIDYIRSKVPHAKGFLFLTGSPERFYVDTDLAIPFRQRRAFMYLSGVNIPDCHMIYEIGNERLTLFIPPLDPESILWSGMPLATEEVLGKFDIDAVLPNTDLQTTLDLIGSTKNEVGSAFFTISGHVIHGITLPGGIPVDSTSLKEAIDECRVVKDEYETALIKKANIISSAAHLAVIKSVTKCKNESEIDGVFLGECTKRGTKVQAYPSIVASGRTAATMHYEANSQDLYKDGKAKEVVVIDAGAEWNCYGAEITRTLPISGKFTPESRSIYEIVLKMQQVCIASLKEGVLWDDLHLLAHKVAIDGLLALGILKGDKGEILTEKISTAFMPHGLGHFLGMDTHDTGGHPNEADPDPMFKYLRVRRRLPAGCVVTVEPGIHFGPHMIRPYLNDQRLSKYIDEEVLDKYWDVGGVCIEDDLVVTRDGSVNLTDVPKDPDKLEAIISNTSTAAER
ncbi:AMP-N domain-containing protein [Fusarium sp. LHS14.1]|nr:AMP-N domain-containing protein [Fusarium sp. LHS14.1]